MRKPLRVLNILRTQGVVYDCDRASAQALLPDGYEIASETEQPTVLFEAMNLRNLPWLAGRGEYSLCSLIAHR